VQSRRVNLSPWQEQLLLKRGYCAFCSLKRQLVLTEGYKEISFPIQKKQEQTRLPARCKFLIPGVFLEFFSSYGLGT
jgi:hypothetical protein